MKNTKKTIGVVVFALVCVMLVVGIFFLNEKEPDSSAGSGNETADNQSAENSEEKVELGSFDFSAPEDGTLKTKANEISVTVPAAKEELQYIPWEFYKGLEVAAVNYEVSKELRHGIEKTNIRYNDRWNVDRNGRFAEGAAEEYDMAYVYLWVSVRNPSEKPIDMSLNSIFLTSLKKDGSKRSVADGCYQYSPSRVPPPEGLTEDELLAYNGALMTLQPGEEREFMIVYTYDLNYADFDDSDFAVLINGNLDSISGKYFRFIRMLPNET